MGDSAQRCATSCLKKLTSEASEEVAVEWPESLDERRDADGVNDTDSRDDVTLAGSDVVRPERRDVGSLKRDLERLEKLFLWMNLSQSAADQVSQTSQGSSRVHVRQLVQRGWPSQAPNRQPHERREQRFCPLGVQLEGMSTIKDR